MPAPQSVHWRFVVALPGVLTYVPSAQELHPVHDGELLVVLYSPAAHVAHPRSAVVEPAAETYLPCEQLVQATHVVAALASSSHVPAAHACFGVSPPGQ